jgi:hypothetical protein
MHFTRPEAGKLTEIISVVVGLDESR